jgi:hypothetical protein
MVKYDFFYSQVGEVSQWGEMGIVRDYFIFL